MKNEIVRIEKKRVDSIINSYKAKNYYIARIDGDKIRKRKAYMEAIIVAFQFPDGMFENINSIDSYNDWMTDLCWLEEYREGKIYHDYDGYILIIDNFQNMLDEDPETKEIIMEEFRDTILPFWEKEVTETVFEGRVKGFIVYLVN